MAYSNERHIKLRRHSKWFKLFPATCLAIDILGPFRKTNDGREHLLIIKNRYLELTRAVTLRIITARAVNKAFYDHSVFVYGQLFTAKHFRHRSVSN